MSPACLKSTGSQFHNDGDEILESQQMSVSLEDMPNS